MTAQLQTPGVEQIDIESLHNPNQFKVTIGDIAEQTANNLTAIRGIGAIVLNRHIANTEEYQSWTTATNFLLLAATDAEGRLARWGRKLQGKDENDSRPAQSYFDHLTDKVLVNCTMSAIASRERKNGHHIYADLISATTAITATRDVLTTADRIYADVNGVDTRAQDSGKKKTFLQYMVLGFALSPLAKNNFGKVATTVGLSIATKQSVTSGLKLHVSLADQRKSKRNARNSN